MSYTIGFLLVLLSVSSHINMWTLEAKYVQRLLSRHSSVSKHASAPSKSVLRLPSIQNIGNHASSRRLMRNRKPKRNRLKSWSRRMATHVKWKPFFFNTLQKIDNSYYSFLHLLFGVLSLGLFFSPVLLTLRTVLFLLLTLSSVQRLSPGFLWCYKILSGLAMKACFSASDFVGLALIALKLNIFLAFSSSFFSTRDVPYHSHGTPGNNQSLLDTFWSRPGRSSALPPFPICYLSSRLPTAHETALINTS